MTFIERGAGQDRFLTETVEDRIISSVPERTNFPEERPDEGELLSVIHPEGLIAVVQFYAVKKYGAEPELVKQQFRSRNVVESIAL